MAGKFLPGVLALSVLIGSYTMAADGESITGDGSEIRTPWINAGTLAKIDWTLASGTFTGVKVRSSASALPATMTDDYAPLQPGSSEWLKKYDPSLGSLPTSQGWSYGGPGSFSTESVSNGVLSIATSTSQRYYVINPAGINKSANDTVVMRAGFRLPTGHQATFEIYMDDGSHRHQFVLYGSASGNAQKVFGNGAQINGLTYNYDTWYDLILVCRYSGGTAYDRRVFWRARGSNTVTDLTGLIDYTAAAPATAATNAILFGCIGGAATIKADIDWVGVAQFTEWESVADSDTAFDTPSNRGHVQLKGTLSNGGVLTELDIMNSLTAPGDVGSISANAVGSTGAGCECAAVSGAGAYEFELRQAGSTLDSKLDEERAVGFAGVSAGSYTVRARACSPDGVRSINYTESSSFPVPAATPAVDITFDDTTIDAGQTASMTATASGGAVTLTKAGSPISSGVPVAAVSANTPAVDIVFDDLTLTPGQHGYMTATTTGGAVTLTKAGSPITSGVQTTAQAGVSGGALIGPTADVPVIGQLPDRDRPVIRYTGGAMRIYLATTQPTTYTVQRRAYPGGTTWATDTTQPASGVITVASLSYNGATPGTSYATNHGLTLSSSYEYRLLPTYSDGSIGQPSNQIVPNDAADYEIAVSGDVPAEWYSATRTAYVRAELSHLVTIGGRDYPTGGAERYRGAIQSDGTWSISGLPRLASAARADGGDATELRATFVFPDGSRVAKVLPNQSSATFASLTAYT